MHMPHAHAHAHARVIYGQELLARASLCTLKGKVAMDEPEAVRRAIVSRAAVSEAAVSSVEPQ